MISQLSLPSIVLLACLPALTWTFVAKPTTRTTTTNRVFDVDFHKPRTAFAPAPFGVCKLLKAKDGEDVDDEDIDPFDADGWEPNEEDLMSEVEDIEDIEDIDELDLDDVESSVIGTDEDEDDEDAINYDEEDEDATDTDDEDDFDDEDAIDEEDNFDDDEDEIDEEDNFDDEEDEDLDIEDGDIEAYLKGDGGMDEKPPDGYSKWWEDYGFESREDFENQELFPGGMKGLIMERFEEPDEDFWDDETTMVSLNESSEDPTYNKKLKDVLESSTRRQAAAKANSEKINLYVDGDDELENETETIEALSKLLDDAIPNDVGVEEFTLDESELEGIDISEELKAASALMDDEDYVGSGRTDIAGTGTTDEDMERLDQSWKDINDSLEKEPWNKVAATRFDFNYTGYPKQYHYDMQQTAVEIESAGYDVYPWLKYDMAFNVTNLILASIKHNPDAPVILQHWYPQLMVCERYQHARDRNFDFTWDDVQSADVEELSRYYYGFGYEEIPKKAPAETGMISFEDADEQEVKMAAMEKWMLDVYNSEWDRKDFDDEDIKDEDNVFSDNFVMPQHPDLPSWDESQEDVQGWKEEWSEEGTDDDEGIAYRDMMGRSVDYKSAQTDDFRKNFRGHLIIACGNFETDLDLAETITTRMEKDFGNAIYAETKIYQHATEGDNLFEVWLESYEIDLLHSRRRSSMNVAGWEGKGKLNDERMNYLVDEIRKLTSEDARLSFRWSEEHVS